MISSQIQVPTAKLSTSPSTFPSRCYPFYSHWARAGLSVILQCHSSQWAGLLQSPYFSICITGQSRLLLPTTETPAILLNYVELSRMTGDQQAAQPIDSLNRMTGDPSSENDVMLHQPLRGTTGGSTHLEECDEAPPIEKNKRTIKLFRSLVPSMDRAISHSYQWAGMPVILLNGWAACH